MNITKEQTGELTATVKMEIMPEDYQEKVDKVLLDYKRKANMPGFRPGHVPSGLIRKMYGKAVLADEVNKILSDGLMNYIRDENLQILGNPLPNMEKNSAVDFDHDISFTFWFDLGLTPEFTVPLSHETSVDYYKIMVDEGMVDKYIDETRHHHGNYIHPDTSAGADIVSGEIVELNESGEPVENGIKKDVFIYLDKVTVEATRTELTGVAKGAEFTFNPVEYFGSLSAASQTLGLKEEQVSRERLKFHLTVKDIVHVEPADLNSEFFGKVYPAGDIQTEEDFRDRVRKDAEASFSTETDKLFFNKATSALVTATEITLPDGFMKRWLLENNEGKYTAEQIEKEYPSFLESMKWQLIENKLIRDNDIQVKDDDIRNYIRTVMLRQVAQTPPDPETEKKYESIVDTFMQNKEQVQRINDQLYNARLLELFKQHLHLNIKDVTYDMFIKILSENHEHHEHEHGHGHDHEHNNH